MPARLVSVVLKIVAVDSPEAEERPVLLGLRLRLRCSRDRRRGWGRGRFRSRRRRFLDLHAAVARLCHVVTGLHGQLGFADRIGGDRIGGHALPHELVGDDLGSALGELAV